MQMLLALTHDRDHRELFRCVIRYSVQCQETVNFGGYQTVTGRCYSVNTICGMLPDLEQIFFDNMSDSTLEQGTEPLQGPVLSKTI